MGDLTRISLQDNLIGDFPPPPPKTLVLYGGGVILPSTWWVEVTDPLANTLRS
jgi:hypothetical protein